MNDARLALHAGYEMIAVGEEKKELRLRAPDGRLCLAIVLTPEGPKVELSAAALSIATEGDVTVDCQRFAVTAREDVVLGAGGEVKLSANDDVTLHGERVRLNAPKR